MQRYFDVESNDVYRRSLMALNLLDNTQFLSQVPDTVESGRRPDLWGPIWIYQTVVFAQFFAASVGTILVSGGKGYDIGSFAASASVMALFTFGLPLLIWFAVQYSNLVPTYTWAQSVCLYGYANSVWVPLAVLLGFVEVIGGSVGRIVKWTLVGIGAVVSGKFVLFNMKRLFEVADSDKSKAAGVLVLCGVVQVASGVAMGLL